MSRLEEIERRIQQQCDMLTTLSLQPAQGPAVAAPLAPEWRALPGLPGIFAYHVPDPDGAPGLFLNVVRMAPGTRVQGLRVQEPTRVCCLDGSYFYNGRLIGEGECHWMAPHEEQNIETPQGCTNTVLFNALPFPISLIPTP